MDAASLPFYLFRTAAVLNAVSVPGHINFGWKYLEPNLEQTLKGKPEHALANASAHVGWDHMTVGIFTAGEFFCPLPCLSQGGPDGSLTDAFR
jgi:hypothetical protein